MSGTLDALSRRIDTTRSLESIVRTMKALSTASIVQYDRAAGTMSRYMRTVELGMTAVLRQHVLPSVPAAAGPLNDGVSDGTPLAGEGDTLGEDTVIDRDTDRGTEAGGETAARTRAAAGTTMAIVFGSDHGFCGNFNERVASFAAGTAPGTHWHWLCVGARAAQALGMYGRTAGAMIHLPGTADGLTETCHRILLTIDDWRTRHRVERILVFHNRRRADTVEPHRVTLAPHERRWLRDLARRPWHSRTLPMFTLPEPRLYAALVREHLFASLFRSGAESLASEHAARLAAMHAALNNIEDHLETMNAEYQRQRQESITAELLDIVAGYEILRKRESAA